MKILVCGSSGFIGGHLVQRLKAQGHEVVGADIVVPKWTWAQPDKFLQGDLRRWSPVTTGEFDEVYQLAANMGGMGHIGNPQNDARILSDNAMINLNLLDQCKTWRPGKIFFSSSACVYPAAIEECEEMYAYPAEPDSEYGWEKLFSERVYRAHARRGMKVRIARYHNIFGPWCTWVGGREKFPAALCRKVAEAPDGGEIEIWGDGTQARSFLYIDECLEGTIRMMRDDTLDEEPVNIGSDCAHTIIDLVDRVIDISGKRLSVKHTPGPVGVHRRNSENSEIRERLGWEPVSDSQDWWERTYEWVAVQVADQERANRYG